MFQGTADGRFAYDATSGEAVETPTGTGVIAAPVTYRSTASSTCRSRWAGAASTARRSAPPSARAGTVYTFAVGGKAPLPAFVAYQQGALLSGVKYDPANVQAGTMLYVSNCVLCHGVPGVDRGGNIPNLGYMHTAYIQNTDKFIFKGPAMSRGMPDFTGKLSMDDVEKIKAFIQATADAVRPKP